METQNSNTKGNKGKGSDQQVVAGAQGDTPPVTVATTAPVDASGKLQGFGNLDEFNDVSLDGPQNWFAMLEGNGLRGILLDRRYAKKQEKHFFRFQITTGETRCQKKVNKDEPAVDVTVGKGAVVCLDDRADLSDLRVLCQDGGKYEMLIVLKGKEKHPTNATQTIWRFTKKKRVLSAPTREVKPEDLSANDDKIPF